MILTFVSRGYVGAIYFIPNLIGILLVNLLPWENKFGLLFGFWTTGEEASSAISRACKLSLQCRFHWRMFCASACLAFKRHCRPYEESDCECDCAFSLLYRQRCWPVDVASKIQT